MFKLFGFHNFSLFISSFVLIISVHYHKVDIFLFSYFFYFFNYIFSFNCSLPSTFLYFLFSLKLKMDFCYLNVENLDIGINECNEFNPKEDEEKPPPLVSLLLTLPLTFPNTIQ